MNLNDVTFDGASAISFRRAPGERDAALSFVFNLGGTRWAGGVWERETGRCLNQSEFWRHVL